ncbi:MAG: FkbM family methyltransferase [Anaerolineales bacterium]
MQLAAWAAKILPEPLKRALYRLGPLTRALRGLLNRAAPTGITETTIAGGDLQGWRMALDLQQEKDYWLGSYETGLQTALRDLIQPGWTVYDVGANVGYITLLLARRIGASGRVFAFEALPQNQVRWQTNVALNNLQARTHLFCGAVTDLSGQAAFLLGPSDDMGKAQGSTGRALTYAESILVPSITLDDFIYRDGNPPPQAIKMDIEGGEVLALLGMRRTLKEVRPLILLELHGSESARVAWEMLTPLGYSLHRMAAAYPQVRALQDLDWKAYLVARPPR